MNEQMNQLGQIGDTGYSPTAEVVDQLVVRSRRARALRQTTAALVGSVGAIGLGLLGAQVFVNLSADESDAATIADRSFDLNQMTWEERYGEGYTGLGKTQDELAQAWEDLQAAAEAKAKEPKEKSEDAAPACEYQTKIQDGWKYYKSSETNCEWVKKYQVEQPEVPDGHFLFGNGHVYKCDVWTDAATGLTSYGNWSGTEWGWQNKAIVCKPGDKYWYEYKYMGEDATFDYGTMTCIGDTFEYKGAPHQLSCRQDTHKVMTDPENYKWFDQLGKYFHITANPEYNGNVYEWTGSWTIVPPPPPPPSPSPSAS